MVVGESWEHEIIERDPHVLAFGDPDRLLDILKRISPRPIVGLVKLLLRRVETDAHAVKARATEPFDRSGNARVGIDVDGAAFGAQPDAADGLLDKSLL